jgi:transcriptional regulator with XRE-family HTH domain
VKKNSNILQKFGKRVRTLRAQKGVGSQMDLSFKAGIDRTYIGGVERGERNLGLENIEKIAKALGVSLEELFKL